VTEAQCHGAGVARLRAHELQLPATELAVDGIDRDRPHANEKATFHGLAGLHVGEGQNVEVAEAAPSPCSWRKGATSRAFFGRSLRAGIAASTSPSARCNGWLADTRSSERCVQGFRSL